MPQALAHSSWSSLHMSRTPRHPAPNSAKPKPNPKIYTPPAAAGVAADMSRDLLRPASTGGKKRPREEPSDPKRARRTRSVGGDARPASLSDKQEREALQRQLIGVFVPRALRESIEGNMVNYSDLVARFLPTAVAPVPLLPPLVPLLRALTAHVSLLDPVIHRSLVNAILQLPWAAGDDRFVKVFVGFAGVLVSADPGWAREIVFMGVKGLTWQPTQSGSVTRRTFHARHHLLLSHLLSLIPTLPNVLQPALLKHAPNKREPEVAQTTWVRNCCELIEYCPELGARVWSSLVDRMLRIDVEITNRAEDDDDDDDEDEEEDEETQVDPFDLLISQDMPKAGYESEDEDDSDDEGDPDPDALSSEEEESEEEREDEAKQAEAIKKRRELLKSMRGKLDGMLVHFVRHLDDCMGARQRGISAVDEAAAALSVASSGTSSATATRPATPTTPTAGPSSSSQFLAPPRPAPTPAQSLAHFQTLLNLFSRQILPTTSTQHLPFLLFRSSSYSAAHTDLFLHRLVSLALYASDTPTPTPTQPAPLAIRTAATVYIGSLVTRARFVTDDQARTVMAYLLAYLDGKLAQAQAQRRGLSADELPLFYAVCQATMLIFCFRWRAFTTHNDEPVTGELEMDLDAETESLPDTQPAGANSWMADLDVLQRVLTSDLNPLLGCNPTVVGTFAKVAHATGFAYCFSIIEANSRAYAPRTASTGDLANGRSRSATGAPTPLSMPGTPRKFTRTASAPTVPSLAAPRTARQANIDAGLDAYFPFDPYDLPRSGEYVEALYRTWDEVAVDLGNESDSDSDDEEEEEEGSEESISDDERRGRMVQSQRRALPINRSYGRRGILDAGLSTSLEGMSISPAAA